MSAKQEHLGALLRALAAGPVASDEAAALVDGCRVKVWRYARSLEALGFRVEQADGVLTLTGGATLEALRIHAQPTR